jgi:hypothetical protein
MKFGKVDINPTDPQWHKWPWDKFLVFYDARCKGNMKETPEEVAEKLGVKVPVPKKEKAGKPEE